MYHNFANSKALGDVGEKIVKDWLDKRGANVKPASLKLQRTGIDFTIEKHGVVSTVEVKYDARAQKTGNVFLETYSNEEADKKGWYYTSKARLLFYIVAPSDMYITTFQDLRGAGLLEHKAAKKKRARNKRGDKIYHSVGHVVPVEAFASVCAFWFKV